MMHSNVGNFTQSNNIVVHLSSTLIQVGIFVVSYMIIVYKKLLLYNQTKLPNTITRLSNSTLSIIGYQ